MGGSDHLVIAFLGELGPGDAAELARARPGSAGGVAFLLDTATWAGPVARPRQGRSCHRTPRRILRGGGWQVVPATAGDDFARTVAAAQRPDTTACAEAPPRPRRAASGRHRRRRPPRHQRPRPEAG